MTQILTKKGNFGAPVRRSWGVSSSCVSYSPRGVTPDDSRSRARLHAQPKGCETGMPRPARVRVRRVVTDDVHEESGRLVGWVYIITLYTDIVCHYETVLLAHLGILQ